MATREELYTALRNADAAGDSAGAQKLAAYIQSMPVEQSSEIKAAKLVNIGRANPRTAILEGQQDVANLGAGAVRGAGSIGATLLTPYDLVAGNTSSISNPERRAGMDNALSSLGADTNSGMYKTGKLAGEVAGTAGAGGATANALGRLGVSAPLVEAVRTGGMAAQGAGLGTRALGGAITGGLTAGMVDPSQAPMGAAIGGGLPVAAKVAGEAGNLVGAGARKLLSGSVPEDVAALAKRAKELGIDIPADRLTNSRPLNAVAASLNYVPLSGRAATEDKMISQLNQAVSRTFGQDSSNVTMALRKANDKLGGQFEHVLSNNGVKFDQQLLEDLSNVHNKASAELGADALKPITSKINDLIDKGASGTIDGQAAYNIKRDLDRIGQGNTTTAFHALELKGALMDALNRSLGPEQAAAFAQTRQHYGNMLSLEKLAKNGVEGEISAARLANMQNINNQPLQELADIAAQFVKGREGQHGAMQRVMVGGIGAGLGLPAAPAMAAGIGTARAVNSALNSNTLKRLMLNEPQSSNKLMELLQSPEGQQLMYRMAPQLANAR